MSRFLYLVSATMILAVLCHAQLDTRTEESTGMPAGKLTCSPTPCRLPNVQASEGGMPVLTSVAAVNPANPHQILLGTEDRNCTSFEGVAVTKDGGTSWRQACLPSPFGGAGDPIAAFDLNGVAYAGGLYSDFGDPPWGISLTKSTDSGRHWGTPVTAMSNTLGYFAWQPWLTIDTHPISPNRNTLYVSATQEDFSRDAQIWVSRSSDGGQTWTAIPVDDLQRPPKYDAFSNMTVGADGTVYLAWLRCRKNGIDCALAPSQIMLSESSDAGATWSTPRVVATATLTPDDGCFFGCLPGTPFWMTNIPAIAVSGDGARLYVVFCNWTGSQMQVEVVNSADGGATWSTAVRVAKSSVGDEFFPWISVDATERVVVTWLDRRNDPNHAKFQPFIAYSTDGGATFSTSFPLSQQLSSPDLFDAFGSYRTHVTVGTSVLATWMDDRTGSLQVEVGGVRF